MKVYYLPFDRLITTNEKEIVDFFLKKISKDIKRYGTPAIVDLWEEPFGNTLVQHKQIVIPIQNRSGSISERTRQLMVFEVENTADIIHPLTTHLTESQYEKYDIDRTLQYPVDS